MSINLAITPMLYKIMDDPNNKRVYSKVMTYVTWIVMYCVIGISFFGHEIIKVMAQNPEYWTAYKVIPFISFGIFFGMFKDISAVGLNITKKTKIFPSLLLQYPSLMFGECIADYNVPYYWCSSFISYFTAFVLSACLYICSKVLFYSVRIEKDSTY